VNGQVKSESSSIGPLLRFGLSEAMRNQHRSHSPNAPFRASKGHRRLDSHKKIVTPQFFPGDNAKALTHKRGGHFPHVRPTRRFLPGLKKKLFENS
jgi:hypothetical protein